MITMRALTVAALATATLVLGACSAGIDTSDAVRVDTPPASIPASDIAALAESTILNEFDANVSIDCGTGDVPFAVGTVVNCIGAEEGVDEEVDVRIEIILIDGDYYEIDISSDGAAAPDVESGFVSSADFGEVVATALEQVVGERGAVMCGPEDVEIYIGAELICSVVLSSGFAEAYVQVVAFDGSTYEITAEIIE